MNATKPEPHPFWNTHFGLVNELGACQCLADVGWEDAGRRMVRLHTGYVNAAQNCTHCHGTGLDEDRFVGGLLRMLVGNRPTIERREDDYRVRIWHEGAEQEVSARGLIPALIACFEIASSGADPVSLHAPAVSVRDLQAGVLNPLCCYCNKRHWAPLERWSDE